MTLKAILRMARWEIQHQTSGLDKQTVLLVIVAFSVTGALFTIGGGASTDIQRGLYTVGVEESSPYSPVVEQSPRLVPREPRADGVQTDWTDIRVTRSGDIENRIRDTQSDSALSSLVDAVERYNRDILISSGERVAAFPVLADVAYVDQPNKPSTEIAVREPREQPDETDTMDGTNTNQQDTNDVSPPDTTSQTGTDSSETSSEETTLNTPDTVNPPFPFEAILLGFLFVMPMNFIVQTFSSSVIDERLDSSGELLLVTPISRYDIILGKMLPYLLTLLAITSVIAVGVGASILSVFAVMSFACAFMGAGFLAGIFARSYKELTFVYLTMSVLLISFALVPAIFTSVHPIAVISPLTVVVAELQGEPLPLIEILFATTPMLLSALIMVRFGAGIYQEEDLFAQLPVPTKFFDMMGEQVHSWKSLFKIGIFVLPFVFAAELLALATLFVVPRTLALPTILILAALIEEIAKSVGVYGGIQKGVLNTRKKQLLAGGASGLGFFLAEKLTVVVQAVGLLDLQIGATTFGPAISQIAPGPLGYLLPIFWIGIHPITTMISTVGMKHGKQGYILSLVIATLVHLLYNGVILYA